ncbi:MAG: sodium:proton antiporter [Phycisphaerae bacterium]|nr:sodium:proton antiporter [Phycisphaerae bacterium]
MFGHHDGAHGTPSLPASWGMGAAPFAILLLAIAVFPLIPAIAGWWHSNVSRLAVAATCGVATLAWITATMGAHEAATLTRHAVLDEYIPFMVLLFSLYVISGGIAIRGNLPAHPGTNTAILAIGTVLASAIGTTGASMVLIRFLLTVNKERHKVSHTAIFFIFLVSNCGGLLLPLGDPPLFLGYLKGVPFLWTLSLWREWLLVNGILLTLYFLWDRHEWKAERRQDISRDEHAPRRISIDGRLNILWLFLVVLVVATVDPSRPLPGTEWKPFLYLRELLMLGLCALSMAFTKNAVRKANEFDFGAIAEVAALFIGIFVTMQVPLLVLHAKGAELGITTPMEYFWATGSLSAVLDNAPTYLVFLQTAVTTPIDGTPVVSVGDLGQVSEPLLTAVSLGAVLMGAMTYIGNGPNFMVKAIAEQRGVRMPSFFGFLGWSCLVLLPTLYLASWLFIAAP